MPAKEAYEKVAGKPLDDKQFAKLQEREQSAYKGAHLTWTDKSGERVPAYRPFLNQDGTAASSRPDTVMVYPAGPNAPPPAPANAGGPYAMAEIYGPPPAPVIGHTVPPVDVSQYQVGVTDTQKSGLPSVNGWVPYPILAHAADAAALREPSSKSTMPAQMAAAIKKSEEPKQLK